eukprot:GEZU01007248.1.p1 GENE.GEZU01007248.1~~GEZU01007248.1.p1  ORF type:complete len:127 (-),score=32.88 GEZU01007248.1:90-470(-)
MNRPGYEELYEVPGEPKIKEEPLEKMTYASVFNIYKEDHTIGNALRMELLNDPNVLFAGYRIPHVLIQNHVEVKVQTTRDSDPRTAFIGAIHRLKQEINTLEEQFHRELDRAYAEKDRAAAHTQMY